MKCERWGNTGREEEREIERWLEREKTQIDREGEDRER